MKNIFSYIEAMRIKTLFVGFSVWLTGVGLSYSSLRSFDFALNFSILFCIFCFQVSVNFFNDVLDFKNNKDTSSRLGPRRMVQSGLISSSSMFKAAILMLILVVIPGLYLVVEGGFFIFCIGFTSMFMVYIYSAPPFSLADRGLAEIFVFLYFGLLAVLGIYHLNMIDFVLSKYTISIFDFLIQFKFLPFNKILPAIVAGSQMGFLSISILLINYLRDYKEDKVTGKKTLIVRLGQRYGFIEYLLCIIFAYVMNFYWLFFEKSFFTFLLPFCVLPFHIYLFIQMYWYSVDSRYNFYLSIGSLAQFLFSICLVIGFLWL